MKKFMKKFCGIFIALSFMALILPFTAYAAEGKLQFSDPTCAAGENVDVNVRVISSGSNVGKYEVKVKYDPKMLKFEQGDNATESKGIITMTYDGGNVADVLHVLKFTALNNGEAKLNVEEYKAETSSGEELNLTTGTSTIKIEGGTPVEVTEDDNNVDDESSDIEVMYKNEIYHLLSDFSDSEVPEGFVKEETDYEGNVVNALVNEVTGQCIYLGLNENNERVYLFEDFSTGNLILSEIIHINKNVSIFVMDYPDDDKMPDHIKPTTMTLNDKKFMIWNNIDNQDFYYVYAFSSEGTKGYYEYDSVENTYQRANVADFIVKDENEEEASPVMDVLEQNLLLIIIACVSLIIVLIIIVITLSIKLHKRSKKVKSRSASKKSVKHTEDIIDDENDVYNIEFDDYDDGELEYDDSFDDDIEDDFEIELEDEPVQKKKKSTGKKKSSKRKKKHDDDDFSIDFIEI